MAPTLVSEDPRETRAEMALASVELAKSLRGLAERFDTARRSKELAHLAYHARRLAALYDRFELEANGERWIADANLRTLARVFQDVAIKVTECADLAGFLTGKIAVEHLGLKLARIGDLTGQALLLADLA